MYTGGQTSAISSLQSLSSFTSASGQESLEYGRTDPSRRPRGTVNPQKLAVTSPTSGGRSVGIVPSRTQATKFFFFLLLLSQTLSREKKHRFLNPSVSIKRFPATGNMFPITISKRMRWKKVIEEWREEKERNNKHREDTAAVEKPNQGKFERQGTGLGGGGGATMAKCLQRDSWQSEARLSERNLGLAVKTS
jgi:hypothetical protein